MSLSKKQAGVLVRMVLGLFLSLVMVLASAYTNPFGYDDSLTAIDRLSVAILSCLIPALVLALTIGRLARHRFFSAQDIDGAYQSKGSEHAKVLQSQLQNTVEQTLLAVIVYCAWSVTMPGACLSVVPVAAILFGVGRLLFFAAYTRGAVARALGFTLSCYTSLIMLSGILSALFLRQFS